jgi:Leucine-rich repeat (LRR) protein
MRTISIILVLTVSLCLTGCPMKVSEVERTISVPTPQELKPPVSATPAIPATPEAKAVAELVDKLKGKWTLTPAQTIKSIIIDSSDLDEAAFDLFAQQPDLETLLIANYRELSDAMVAKLTGLKKLKKLQLKNSGITDNAVKTVVESFPALTGLDISSNTLLTDTSLKEIAKLKELTELTINYCNFSEFGMMDISELPKLTTLDIRANMQVGNSGLDYLTALPSLKSLKHLSPAVDDTGLESLSAVKGLETLEIQDFNITDRAGQFIRQFEKLTNLIIMRCQGFGSSGILELKGMKLNRLTLRGLPSINDAGMEVFRELTTLKRLYLNELASVSDAGILNLVYLKDLDTLDIWEIPITDQSLETISKLASLKTLSIRSTQITDSSADLLLTMPKLENLTLKDNTNVTQSALNKLRNSKKFKNLDFGSAGQQEE